MVFNIMDKRFESVPIQLYNKLMDNKDSLWTSEAVFKPPVYLVKIAERDGVTQDSLVPPVNQRFSKSSFEAPEDLAKVVNFHLHHPTLKLIEILNSDGKKYVLVQTEYMDETRGPMLSKPQPLGLFCGTTNLIGLI